MIPPRGPAPEMAAFEITRSDYVKMKQHISILGQNDTAGMPIMPLWVCQNDTFDTGPVVMLSFFCE